MASEDTGGGAIPWLFFWSVSPVFRAGRAPRPSAERLGPSVPQVRYPGLGDGDGGWARNKFSLFSGLLTSLASGRKDFNGFLGVSFPARGERPGVQVQISPGI